LLASRTVTHCTENESTPLMHEAALSANEDPDRLSFIHAVRVVRRKLATFNAIPPCAEENLS